MFDDLYVEIKVFSHGFEVKVTIRIHYQAKRREFLDHKIIRYSHAGSLKYSRIIVKLSETTFKK